MAIQIHLFLGNTSSIGGFSNAILVYGSVTWIKSQNLSFKSQRLPGAVSFVGSFVAGASFFTGPKPPILVLYLVRIFWAWTDFPWIVMYCLKKCVHIVPWVIFSTQEHDMVLTKTGKFVDWHVYNQQITAGRSATHMHMVQPLSLISRWGGEFGTTLRAAQDVAKTAQSKGFVTELKTLDEVRRQLWDVSSIWGFPK